MNKVARFLELPFPTKLLFFQAWLLLPWTAISVRLWGLRRTLLWVARLFKTRTARLESDPLPRAIAASTALRGAIRVNPVAGKCLSQSIALWGLLRRQGIETDLRIGVSKADTQVAFSPNNFLAHAWLELDGHVINDSPEIGLRFAPHSPEITRLYLK
jgi:hypothetical protein